MFHLLADKLESPATSEGSWEQWQEEGFCVNPSCTEALVSLRLCKDKWDHFFSKCVELFVEEHNENTRYSYEWTDILIIFKSLKLSCHLLLLFKNHLSSIKWCFAPCQKCHITGWDSWYESHPWPSLWNKSAFHMVQHNHSKELKAHLIQVFHGWVTPLNHNSVCMR